MTADQPQPGDFPFSVDLVTRFGDLDVLQHINNLAIANLYQEARVQFSRTLFADLRGGLGRSDGIGTVLADLHISYRRETFYPTPVTVCSGIARLGKSSVTIKSAMFQDGYSVGTCQAILVYVKDGKSHPIPPEEREIFMEYRLPESEQ